MSPQTPPAPTTPRPPRDSLASKIREAARSRRASANALAAETGLDRRLIARFLKGEKDVTLSTADRLCLALGLRLTESARGKSSRTPPRPAPAFDFEAPASAEPPA